jgi:hypothetical protein
VIACCSRNHGVVLEEEDTNPLFPFQGFPNLYPGPCRR